MRIIIAAVVVTLLSAAARSAEPVSFSPATLVSHQTDANRVEHFIAVFSPAGNVFEIPLPLIPRWFAFGPTGRAEDLLRDAREYWCRCSSNRSA
jgi:hypothetical protein